MSKGTKVYGYSDDLIEIEGELNDEIECYPGTLLQFSDGTKLKISYDDDGIWRIAVLEKGDKLHDLIPATNPEDDYSDTALFLPGLDWHARIKEKSPKEKRVKG